MTELIIRFRRKTMKSSLHYLAALLVLASNPAHAGWTRTVSHNGKTTVTGDSESMAQKDKQEALRADVQKAIAEAPKRQANDPIRVVFLHPKSGDNSIQNQDKLQAALLDEFKNDPILRVFNADVPVESHTSAPSLDALRAYAGSHGKGGDVYVLARPGTEDVIGRNKSTGKLAQGKAFAYKAESVSAYEPTRYHDKELGSIFDNVQITKALAAKIKITIKEKIAPGLPSPTAVAEIQKKFVPSGSQEQSTNQLSEDKKEMLRKLFQKRH
jgi:hypothetical protein